MYEDTKGNIIAVDKGPYANWTFYRKPRMKTRGKRVKVRNIPNFYPTQAESALISSPEKRSGTITLSRKEPAKAG